MDIVLIYVLSWGVFLLVAGYVLPFIQNKPLARITAWGIIIATAVFAAVITAQEPPLYRMIAIVSLQLQSMKSIVMVETYTGKPSLNPLQWLAFAQGWFGMRPRLFEAFPSKPLPGVLAFVSKGLSRIGIGLLLLLASVYVQKYIPVYFLPEVFMLTGISFILHFGMLNLSTGGWRAAGVDVKELFRSPYKSKSVKEFWGKRWNMAFSEMTALVVYKPLKDSYGKTVAMLASFLVSGILHEIAISFPVNRGYGLPLLYFIIHGVVMYAEDQVRAVKNITVHPVWSHVWVFGWLIIPMPLLFHAAFIQQIAAPLRNQILTMIGLAG